MCNSNDFPSPRSLFAAPNKQQPSAGTNYLREWIGVSWYLIYAIFALDWTLGIEVLLYYTYVYVWCHMWRPYSQIQSRTIVEFFFIMNV